MVYTIIIGIAALLYALSAVAGALVVRVAPSVDVLGIDLLGFAPGALASWTLAAALLTWMAWRLRRRERSASSSETI